MARLDVGPTLLELAEDCLVALFAEIISGFRR